MLDLKNGDDWGMACETTIVVATLMGIKILKPMNLETNHELPLIDHYMSLLETIKPQLFLFL